jgi:large subunit ribosomal protein L24
MKFLIGDSVIVTTGKDKGEVGVVGKIFTKTNKVWIDGVNKKIKHVKKKDGEAGSKVDFFAPIDASNIAYQDPKTKKAVKIGYTIEDGVKIRIIKKTQEKIVKNKITKK